MIRAIERAKGDSLIPRSSLRGGRGQIKSGDLHPGSLRARAMIVPDGKLEKPGKLITSRPSYPTMCIFLKTSWSSFEYTWDSLLSPHIQDRKKLTPSGEGLPKAP